MDVVSCLAMSSIFDGLLQYLDKLLMRWSQFSLFFENDAERTRERKTSQRPSAERADAQFPFNGWARQY